MAVYTFYYIWWIRLKILKKPKVDITILKPEFIILFYFQKLYNILYQYQFLKHFSVIAISIYRGEWEKVDFLLGEPGSLKEFYFWEPYTVHGEEEFWKNIGIEPKSMMGVIKKKFKSDAILEVDEDDEDLEEMVEESKRVIAKKVRKQPNEGDLIPTWTVPTWLHYKQRYKLCPAKSKMLKTCVTQQRI